MVITEGWRSLQVSLSEKNGSIPIILDMNRLDPICAKRLSPWQWKEPQPWKLVRWGITTSRKISGISQTTIPMLLTMKASGPIRTMKTSKIMKI